MGLGCPASESPVRFPACIALVLFVVLVPVANLYGCLSDTLLYHTPSIPGADAAADVSVVYTPVYHRVNNHLVMILSFPVDNRSFDLVVVPYTPTDLVYVD